eukprot:3078226-Rhodomonas_salina.2
MISAPPIRRPSAKSCTSHPPCTRHRRPSGLKRKKKQIQGSDSVCEAFMSENKRKTRNKHLEECGFD